MVQVRSRLDREESVRFLLHHSSLPHTITLINQNHTALIRFIITCVVCPTYSRFIIKLNTTTRVIPTIGHMMGTNIRKITPSVHLENSPLKLAQKLLAR